ncbi:SpoVR family protein [Sporolactobacillus terrae]|uniref:Stage V sporulation protein R n=1 Tax=Sporolactobacillus terrae TaxID=269673 RepID=A0ABX5QBW2_9BACL|nr:SpoVR family protein [Sporolactobacillus terrae]QAA24071.1 stage V sporulation protein R [Sporolactobacillus terrae]QAA27042.1 stage V sporulation protein R [Sporolactobacillus terrae]UAK15193.1 SpoVR family protein [Sporolactobacillus terrae]
MNDTDHKELERSIEEITEVAEGFGLDFYPMRYEICPAEIIYTFGAYGMPTRFSHWSFGKQFYKMKLQYDLGLSKIYELVINSDPCYAFLLNTNSLIQNKMIAAHVLAHCDFFKNNVRFSNTRRDMVESMSATAERIHNYEEQYGSKKVEKFLDAVLAIQEHVDPRIIRKGDWLDSKPGKPVKKKRKPISQYQDLIDMDKTDEGDGQNEEETKFPNRPEKDLLFFIEEYSRVLEDWQRDILTMLREEMLYFWPQLETKIMNEGWASYWHQRILRELDLTSDEAVEFAKLNAQVVQPSQQSLNPYYLGLKIFEDIEERYNHPSQEMLSFGVKEGTGREKIFEVRELESDQSFIRNYLTKQLVQREDLFMFEKKGDQYTITDKDWKNVRDQLVSMRINGGFPYIVVENGDYHHSGELLLKHRYEGTELDLRDLEGVLNYLFQLWGRPVHLETVIEDHPTLFSSEGKEMKRKRLDS